MFKISSASDLVDEKSIVDHIFTCKCKSVISNKVRVN